VQAEEEIKQAMEPMDKKGNRSASWRRGGPQPRETTENNTHLRHRVWEGRGRKKGEGPILEAGKGKIPGSASIRERRERTEKGIQKKPVI